MSNYRPYTVAMPVRCDQNGPLDKQVYFLCGVDPDTGERFAKWNGCDSVNGSAECVRCHTMMIKAFKQTHPEYQAVV